MSLAYDFAADDGMAPDPDTSMHSAASSFSDLDSLFTTQPDDVSTTPTSRHPSGQQPPPVPFQQTQSRSQATLNAIESQRSILQNLTVEAHRQLMDQPRATQLALATQTREVHNAYEVHGSQSRLSWNLWEFLTAREDLKRSGGEGELVFWSHDEAQKMKSEEEREDLHMRSDEGAKGEHAKVKKSVWETQLDEAMCVKAEDMFHEDVWKGSKGAKRHPNRSYRINGEINFTNVNDSDTAGLPISAPLAFGSQTETYNLQALFTSPPDGSVHLNSNIFISPRTVQATLPNSSTVPPPQPLVSYSNDPSSTEILRSLEFRPADIVFSFPSYTDFPGTAVEYLTRMNNVVKLHNGLANAILRHHDMKYLSQYANSPEDVTRYEHGYVVLRAGIGQMIRDRVTEMFGSAVENNYGFTAETRGFLRQVFDSKELGTAVRSGSTLISGLPKTTGYAEGGVLHGRVPVWEEGLDGDDSHDSVGGYERGEVVAGRGKMSGVEAAMLARVSRVPVEGLSEWWEERRKDRLPLTGMRAWVAAREVERSRKASDEGRYYGWERWTEEEWAEIGGGNLKGSG